MNLLSKDGKLVRIGTKLVKYVLDCFCCCPPCPDDCDCTVTFTVELPGIASSSGSFTLAEGETYFSDYEQDGYVTGYITITCECGYWVLWMDMCYATGGEGTVALYRSKVLGGEDGCPPSGTLDLELIDGWPGPTLVSVHIYC